MVPCSLTVSYQLVYRQYQLGMPARDVYSEDIALGNRLELHIVTSQSIMSTV